MVDMKMEESAKEYIYRSKLPNIDIPYHLPLHTFCFQNIDDYRDKPCIINGGTDEVYTYSEVELTARRVATGLYRLGVKQGDVIMILLPNSPEFVFAFLGASFRGAVSTTANPLYTPQEIAKQANAARAKAIVTQACYVDKVRDMADERGMKVVCIDAPPPGCSHFSELTGADEGDLLEVEILPDDVVALPYSSGTTGLPKGVMLTHKGQVTSVSQQVSKNLDSLIATRRPLKIEPCISLIGKRKVSDFLLLITLRLEGTTPISTSGNTMWSSASSLSSTSTPSRYYFVGCGRGQPWS